MINGKLSAALVTVLAISGYVVWSDGLPGIGGTPRADDVQLHESSRTESVMTGPLNPLAAQTIAEFDAILARPLFNTSRRAPAPVEIEAPVIIAATPAPVEPEVSAEDFTLVAIASNTKGAFAVVKVNATGETLHVQQGGDLSGWSIAAISGREITLARDGKTITLKLFANPAGPALPPDRADAAAPIITGAVVSSD